MHYETQGQVVAAVQPGTLVDDIKKTGNDILVSFEHGNTLIVTLVPDRFADLQIVDGYTDKHDCQLVEGADGILDMMRWEFECESGNTWVAAISVEPWRETIRQRKPRLFAMRGMIWQKHGGSLHDRFKGRVDVEID